jgi:CheY-like chemotaxis protein
MGRVLLLEDNPELLDVLREVVALAGHDVRSARNGREGLEVLLDLSRAPEIIICDLIMPDMDGLTFIRQVRANPAWNNVFCIAMSGAKHEAKMAVEAGADQYLVKPFSVADLNDILDEWTAK